jgi:acetate kinase
VRSLATKNMSYLGIELDETINKQRIKGIVELNTQTSKVKILKIPTNEELEIAKQCYTLIQK